jgi:phosphoribosyl 1,2-cyclic phosphate phosphodiesterase
MQRILVNCVKQLALITSKIIANAIYKKVFEFFSKPYLTHISHHMGFHEEVQKELPRNVFLAYDGLEIEF